MLVESVNLVPHAILGEASSPVAADRRDTRRRAVFLRATIYPVDTTCDVHVRDVSSTGIMCEVDLELFIGQVVHLTVGERAYHAGKVKWIAGRRFGVDLPDFAKFLGSELAETDHGNLEGHHPRASRFSVSLAARLAVGRPPRPAIIRNLSRRGMLLDTSPGLVAGQQLLVQVGNHDCLHGRAQWSVSGRIGLKASLPIAGLPLLDE